MSYRTALTALSALTVSGIAHNYDIDAIPTKPLRGQLPALLVLPMDVQDNRLFREVGKGFETLAFSQATKTVEYTLTHLLLIAPIGQSSGIRAHLPALVTYMDAYFAALGANPTLGGLLLEPPSVRVEPGSFALNGVEYYGCAFRHRWLLSV
jgi:hypothetical protein